MADDMDGAFCTWGAGGTSLQRPEIVFSGVVHSFEQCFAYELAENFADGDGSKSSPVFLQGKKQRTREVWSKFGWRTALL